MLNRYLGQSVYIRPLNRIGIVTGIFHSWSVDHPVFETNCDVTYIDNFYNDYEYAGVSEYIAKRPVDIRVNSKDLLNMRNIDFNLITMEQVMKQEQELLPLTAQYLLNGSFTFHQGNFILKGQPLEVEDLLIGPFKTYTEGPITLHEMKSGCECGASKIGSGLHAEWCSAK